MSEAVCLKSVFVNGHVFALIEEAKWLFDTGGPASFGEAEELRIANIRVPLARAYAGINAAKVSEFVGERCAGLLGADILGKFDFIIDLDAGLIKVSESQMTCQGNEIELEMFMGVPIVKALIAGEERRMFFDTGAQLSYLQHDGIRLDFPGGGPCEDFFPGIGRFTTQTNMVDMSFANTNFTLRCGVLPAPIEHILGLAKADGVLGNEIMTGHRIGYFPRRRKMVVG